MVDESNAINEKLSQRELEILSLLVQGKSNKSIAMQVGISLKMVEKHLINVYRKLGVHSRIEAVLWGIEHLKKE